jgi:hypothetical protein
MISIFGNTGQPMKYGIIWGQNEVNLGNDTIQLAQNFEDDLII